MYLVMFLPIYFAGGLLSGICKTRVEPAAFRLLREVNRDNTGWLSSINQSILFDINVI